MAVDTSTQNQSKRVLLLAGTTFLLIAAAVVVLQPRGGSGGHAVDGRSFDAGHGVFVISDDLDGSVTARVAGRQDPPSDFAAATNVFEVTVDGSFDGNAIVELPLLDGVPDDAVMIGATADQLGEWTILDTPLQVVDGRVQVPTTHFSWFSALWVDVQDILGEAREILDDLTGGATASASPPECDSEDQPRRDGYVISSDDGDALFWCLGEEGGQVVLKVVNNRRYAVGLERSGDARTLSSDLEGLANFSRLGSGTRTILGPRGTAVFDVERARGSRRVVFSSSFDGPAQGFYQLEVGVRTALAFLTRLGLDGGRTPLGVADTLLTVGDCASAVDEGAGEIIASCFSLQNIANGFGPAGGLVAAAVFVGPIIEFFQSELTGAFDIIRGRDQYSVGVTRRGASAPAGPDIHEIDFNNVTLPAASCRSGSWNSPNPIPVVDGFGQAGDKALDPLPDGSYDHAEVYVEEPPVFADFDGDGSDEAMLTVGCGAGGTYVDTFALVLQSGSNGLELLGGLPITAVVASDTGTTLSRIVDVTVEGTDVVVEEMYPLSEDEPQCCFTGRETVRWSWDGSAWTR